MNCYTREEIEKVLESKGYKYFTNGDYNLNIVGVRNSSTKNRVTNAFDDCLTISYKINGEWQFECFKCTTDPGTHWVDNLLNEDGVAILPADNEPNIVALCPMVTEPVITPSPSNL